MTEPTFDLETQVRQHGAALQRLARELVHDRATADDAVQQTWLRALRRPPRHGAAIGAWLATLLRNAVRGARRVDRRRDRREQAVAATRSFAGEDQVLLTARAETAHRLVAAVQELPAPYGEAIWQRWFEGLPPRTIAARHGVPVATAKSWLARGLALLRERLDGDAGRDWRGACTAAFGITGAATTTNILTGGLLVTTWTKGTVAAAAVLLAAWLVYWPGDAEAPRIPAGGGGSGTVASAAMDPIVGPAEGRSEVAPAVEPAAPPADASPLAPPAPALVPGVVRGRAIDADNGQPLAGVVVTRNKRPDEPSAEVVTGDDGVFELEACIGARTHFVLRRSGRVSIDGRRDVPPGGQVADFGDVPMRPGRTMRGRLAGPADLAIPADVLVVVEFDVRYTTSWAERNGTARSDADGRFAVGEPLPIGPSKWSLPFGGVMLPSLDATSWRALPAIVDIGPVEPAEIVLPVVARPSIHGIVVERDGTPVGTEVRLGDQPGIGTVSTAPDGTFTFWKSRPVDAIPIVVAHAPGYLPAPPLPAVPWGTTGLRIVLERTAPFALEVVDASGAPIEAFAVAVRRTGSAGLLGGNVRQRGQHAGGKLLVEDVVRGQTLLRVLPTERHFAPSQPIEVGAQEPLRVVLQRRAPMPVLVVHGERPRPGVRVEMLREIGRVAAPEKGDPSDPYDDKKVLLGGDGLERVDAGTTDSDGRVLLACDPLLTACLARVHVEGRPILVVRDLEPPRPGEPLRIELPAYGTLAARVDLRGTGPNDVRVAFRGTQYVDDRAVKVDQDGASAPVTLPAGVYTVELQRLLGRFHVTAVRDVMVEPDRPAVVEFDLAGQMPASVRGVVTTAAGALPPELHVDLLRRSPDGALLAGGSARVAADGTFVIAEALPGEHRVAMRTSAGHLVPVPALSAAELVIHGGESVELPLRWTSRRLVVRMVRPGGEPVRGERVLIRCGGATWPSLRLLTPLVDEVLVLDPAPELPVAFRSWTEQDPWSQEVTMPPDRDVAEVTVVLPASSR
jgi:RNA polymerase sigma-70 factor (ECF subfamily)